MILILFTPDVPPPANPHTLVVLMPGADVRVLGLSSRVRNRRVAARAGATVIDGAKDSQRPPDAILVPPDVLIEPSLFAEPPADTTSPVEADGRRVLDVRTPEARRRAAWVILRRTEKPTDGWVSRNCNRPISRIMSFGLLSLGLSAWHASILTLLAGLLGAAIAAQPGYASFIMAGVLFQLASILDGVDGEMARSTLTESQTGARVDTIVDQVTYVAFFIGVMIGWSRENGDTQIIMWVLLVAAALVASLLRGARFVSEHAPNASFVFIDRSVRRAARDSGKAALRTIASLFTLLRRDVFAVVFVFVSLTGQRAMVPALVVFGVVLANFTFSVYDRELAAAAAAERLGPR